MKIEIINTIVVAIGLCIFLSFLYLITSYNDPYSIYVGSDVELDYYFNSLLINDGYKPNSFSHPGTIIQYLGSFTHNFISGPDSAQSFFNLVRYYGVIFMGIVFVIFQMLFGGKINNYAFFICVGLCLSWPNVVENFSSFSPNMFLVPMLLVTLSVLWKIFDRGIDIKLYFLFITLLTLVLSIKMVVFPLAVLVTIAFYFHILINHTYKVSLIYLILFTFYSFVIFILINGLSISEFLKIFSSVVKSIAPGGVANISFSNLLFKLSLTKGILGPILGLITITSFLSLLAYKKLDFSNRRQKLSLLILLIFSILYYLLLDLEGSDYGNIHSEFHYAIPIAASLPFFILFYYETLQFSSTKILNFSKYLEKIFLLIVALMFVISINTMSSEKTEAYNIMRDDMVSFSSEIETIFGDNPNDTIAVDHTMEYKIIDGSMFHLIGDWEYSAGRYFDRTIQNYSNYTLFIPSNLPLIREKNQSASNALNDRILKIVCDSKSSLIRENDGFKAKIIMLLGDSLPKSFCLDLVAIIADQSKLRRYKKSSDVIFGESKGFRFNKILFAKEQFNKFSVTDDDIISQLNNIYGVEYWKDFNIKGSPYRAVWLK
jgi:hypothetical protein